MTEIKTFLEESFLTIAPGISTKPLDGNQTRFATLKEALKNGSNFFWLLYNCKRKSFKIA